MLRFYRQEIKRVESEKEKINCMINSIQNKKTELENEVKTYLFESNNSNNWQIIVINKKKIENYTVQNECLNEVLQSYEDILNKYKDRLKLFQESEAFRHLKLE